jgi:hypothetical protein
MMHPRISARHARSLAAIQEYRILATAPEPQFDVFPALCRAAFDAPAAYLSFFDGERFWIKAEAGTPRVHDARLAGRLRDAFEATGIVSASGDGDFFAGAPVCTPEGVAVGAIGVLDDRPRELTPSLYIVIGTVATAVSHALEARKAAHPVPVAPGRRNIYAIAYATRTTVAGHSIAAVLSKIEAGRRLLRSEGSDPANAFVSAMQHLLDDNGGPHVLVMFSIGGQAADELVAQARRARLLCNHDLVAFIDGEYVAMLLRDMPVAVGYQAVKRFALAQLNTNYCVQEVRGPLTGARELLDGLIERLRQLR